MSSKNYEERGGATTGAACQYATLANYYNNKHNLGPGGTQNPQPKILPGQTLKPNSQTHHYVVPVFGGIGFDTLQGTGSCSGYSGINNAYSNTGGGCAQKYINRSCQ